jgi:3-deoxy-manno-octulosonate cytidylyltransferase (CMP-KDO synthetase)
MSAAIIIPARYASTRLLGKPLLSETGKALIQHTYEQAMKSKRASQVIVATDDARIKAIVEGFGGVVVMTRGDHDTGSARVAEAAGALDADIIVNLQGDEPEIDPAHIDRVIALAAKHDAFAATLVCAFPPEARAGHGSPDDPSAVKAILGKRLEGDAFEVRYFTRHMCPYPRLPDGAISHPEQYYLHLGIYAFVKENLLTFAQTPPGVLERAEKLEQLRILEAGDRIVAGRVSTATPGIDTCSDYDAFVKRQAARR